MVHISCPNGSDFSDRGRMEIAKGLVCGEPWLATPSRTSVARCGQPRLNSDNNTKQRGRIEKVTLNNLM